MKKSQFRAVDKLLDLLEEAIDNDIELPEGVADAAEVARDEIGGMWDAYQHKGSRVGWDGWDNYDNDDE